MRRLIREAMGEGALGISSGMSYDPNIYMSTDELVALAAEAVLERLRDPDTRRRIAEGFTTDEPALVAGVGWDRVRLGVRDLEINGMLVSDVAEMRGVTPEDAFMDVMLEQEGRGIVIDWNNEEETLRQVLAAPFVVDGTDGSAQNLEDEENLPPLAHPRHFGTYPRLLGTYVRDEGLLTWSEAIHKLTGLTAEIVGLEDRGTLEPGKATDVVVFDPETIRGRATFEDPFHYSEGIHHVFVNGVAVVRDAESTDALPGRALRGPGFESAESDGSTSD